MIMAIVLCSKFSLSRRKFCSGMRLVRTFPMVYYACEHPQGVDSSLTSPQSVSSCWSFELSLPSLVRLSTDEQLFCMELGLC